MAGELILRRVLALGLLASIPLTIYFILVAPFTAALARRDDALHQTLQWTARYRAVAATFPELERQLRELPPASMTSPSYLAGAKRSDALITLQDRVAAVVRDREGLLRSLRILDPVDVDGFRRVGVRIQLQTTESGLAAIAHALETGPPLLFFERLEIQAQPVRDPRAESPMLEVGADIVGFLAGVEP